MIIAQVPVPTDLLKTTGENHGWAVMILLAILFFMASAISLWFLKVVVPRNEREQRIADERMKREQALADKQSHFIESNERVIAGMAEVAKATRDDVAEAQKKLEKLIHQHTDRSPESPIQTVEVTKQMNKLVSAIRTGLQAIETGSHDEDTLKKVAGRMQDLLK